MVYLSKIYTKSGDDGSTGLGDGTRVSKDDPRIEACGAVDELNAALGLARLRATEPALQSLLESIQNDLFDVGADLCMPREDSGGDKTSRLRIAAGQVERLEREIDRVNANLAPLRSFILPGGSELASWLHLGRTICRRAERRVATLRKSAPINPQAAIYLNRLSDLLFVLARAANNDGRDDVLWRPGANQSDPSA
jgi:cob(I)alamin adenosyltransferase